MKPKNNPSDEECIALALLAGLEYRPLGGVPCGFAYKTICSPHYSERYASTVADAARMFLAERNITP